MKNPLLFIVVLLAILGSFLLLGGPSNQPTPVADDPNMGTGEAQIGGGFTLTDQDGKPARDSDYRGRIMLVFFGFTNCPDICPVTSATFAKTLLLLGDNATRVAPIFITVDPKRDTPDVIKKYLAEFDPRIIGLTGTDEEIKAVVDAYKAYFARSQSVTEGVVTDDRYMLEEQPEDAHEHAHAHGDHDAAGGEDDNYLVDHSGYVYMMDKNGKYIRHFQYNVSEQELVAAIKESLQ